MFFPVGTNERLSLDSILDSPEDLWIRKKGATWLLRILEYETEMDDNFFACCTWVLGNMTDFLQEIRENLPLPKKRSREITNARNDLKRLVNVPKTRACRMLERICDENPITRAPMRDHCVMLLEKWLKTVGPSGKSIFPRSFASLFGLDAQAVEFCTFIWGITNYQAMESFFEDSLSLTSNQNLPILARLLNMGKQPFRLMLSHLQHLGIIEDSRHTLRLGDSMLEALTLGKKQNLQNFFCRPVPPTDVPIEQFNIPEEEKNHVLQLLGKKGQKPVHLLLYGDPGTGKTSFASRIVDTLGVKAWAVACREQDSVSDRRLALMACIHLSQLHPDSIILVDEAERLLDTDNGDLKLSSSKAWLNTLLERESLRIIWITNKVTHLDQAVRRRFSFSIHFETPGKKESLCMWNNVAARLRVEKRFPSDAREKFSELYKVPVAVMENAVEQAKRLAAKNNFPEYVERILKAYVCLKQDGAPSRHKKTVSENYRAELTCADQPLDALVEKLKNLRDRMTKENLAGLGNLLFYGPPGTGKTAFAKHLAEELNCGCVVRRASDLLSPWVGETEHKIAEAFALAEQNRDLLLVDEVDSFIFSREGASRSWEQTMVNEFLTSLENFQGLCICTTNFRQIIDSAAMRRFPFKVGFNYAKPDQIVQLYNLCLAPLSKKAVSEEIYSVLRKQKNLAPGDFKAVRSQFWLDDPEKISHKAMLNALLREQSLKLEGEAKSVGF